MTCRRANGQKRALLYPPIGIHLHQIVAPIPSHRYARPHVPFAPCFAPYQAVFLAAYVTARKACQGSGDGKLLPNSGKSGRRSHRLGDGYGVMCTLHCRTRHGEAKATCSVAEVPLPQERSANPYSRLGSKPLPQVCCLLPVRHTFAYTARHRYPDCHNGYKRRP